MRVVRRLPVYQDACLVRVPVDAECPLEERVDAADIRGTVKEYERTALMLVEHAFQLVLRRTQVLVPLSWKELKHTALHQSGVLFLQLFYASQALVKILITDDAR